MYCGMNMIYMSKRSTQNRASQKPYNISLDKPYSRCFDRPSIRINQTTTPSQTYMLPFKMHRILNNIWDCPHIALFNILWLLFLLMRMLIKPHCGIWSVVQYSYKYNKLARMFSKRIYITFIGWRLAVKSHLVAFATILKCNIFCIIRRFVWFGLFSPALYVVMIKPFTESPSVH